MQDILVSEEILQQILDEAEILGEARLARKKAAEDKELAERWAQLGLGNFLMDAKKP